MSVRVSVCLSVRMCYIICKLPVLLQLSENMSSSVIIVAIQRAGLPDNSVSILGWRGSLSCTPECSAQLLASAASPRLVLCIFAQG